MNNTVDIFISLLRSAVTGISDEIDLTDVDYEALFSLSNFHDLAHVVFYELNKRIDNWQGEACRKFKQQYSMAIYRYVKRDLAIEQVRKVLESAAIPFILLKGAYLMELYPEAWMRTSADIDVLVEPRDHKRACEALKDAEFVFFSETPHDASFYTQDKYHVELHHSLIEEDRLPKTTEILDQVWQHAAAVENGFERKLDDEMFYFYHLAHMAKHLKNGGCGVRFFIDLWLLDHRVDFDPDRRARLIGKSGLSEFAAQSVKLSEKWLSAEEEQTDLCDFEEYVIRGGIYGSLKYSIAMRKIKTKSRFRYYLERLFPPYNKLKYSYTILKRFPVFLPFCWVLRWFKLLDPKMRRRAANEMITEDTIESETVTRVERLMRQLKIG